MSKGDRISPWLGLSWLILTSLSLAACGDRDAAAPASAPDEQPEVTFERLVDGVWMHTSVEELPVWGPVPANGLLVLGETGVVLVDSAWTNEQTTAILDWAEETLDRPIIAAVFTHAHQDKMGGVESIREAGIPTYAHPLSNTLAPDRGLVAAEHDLVVADDGSLSLGGSAHGAIQSTIDMYFPGAAHATDNIVVYARETDVLFGGCMIRPSRARSLGNTADGDVAGWEDATVRVAERYPGAAIVVPSHGPPGGPELLSVTTSLARAAREEAAAEAD